MIIKLEPYKRKQKPKIKLPRINFEIEEAINNLEITARTWRTAIQGHTTVQWVPLPEIDVYDFAEPNVQETE